MHDIEVQILKPAKEIVLIRSQMELTTQTTVTYTESFLLNRGW